MWCWLHRHRHRRESKCWEPNHRQREHWLREMIGNYWLGILVGNFPTVPNVRLFLRWSPWWLLRGSWQQTQRRPSKSIPTFSPYSWCLRDEWNYNKRLVTGLTVTYIIPHQSHHQITLNGFPQRQPIYTVWLITYYVIRTSWNVYTCVRVWLSLNIYLKSIEYVYISRQVLLLLDGCAGRHPEMRYGDELSIYKHVWLKI